MHPRRGPRRRHSYRSRQSLHPRRRFAPVRETQPESTDTINIADRVEEVRILCREISSAMSNVEKWMNAIYNISRAVRDKHTLGELISAISALETQDNKEELKEVPTVRTEDTDGSRTENARTALIDLLQKLSSRNDL